jgi:hypothetical protein
MVAERGQTNTAANTSAAETCINAILHGARIITPTDGANV